MKRTVSSSERRLPMYSVLVVVVLLAITASIIGITTPTATAAT